jgi:hypothetical protein
VRNVSHSKKNWARYDKRMYIGLHVKYPLFLSDFNEFWIIPTDFRKIFKYQISWKSVQMEPSCSMRTRRRTDRQTNSDRQSDMTKLTFAFRNFVKVPEECHNIYHALKSVSIYITHWRVSQYISRTEKCHNIYHALVYALEMHGMCITKLFLIKLTQHSIILVKQTYAIVASILTSLYGTKRSLLASEKKATGSRLEADGYS